MGFCLWVLDQSHGVLGLGILGIGVVGHGLWASVGSGPRGSGGSEVCDGMGKGAGGWGASQPGAGAGDAGAYAVADWLSRAPAALPEVHASQKFVTTRGAMAAEESGRERIIRHECAKRAEESGRERIIRKRAEESGRERKKYLPVCAR